LANLPAELSSSKAGGTAEENTVFCLTNDCIHTSKSF
jgi:hypothetical protein